MQRSDERLVELEPAQAVLLEKVCAGPTISVEELRVAGAFAAQSASWRIAEIPPEPDLFDRTG